MYQHYFGLIEPPFSIAVNPRYLFMSGRHRDALAHLLYGVGSGGGFILLTGEVGTGKTTLNRSLIEQLPDDTDIAIVLNPALSAAELLASVCDELAIDYPAGTDSLKLLTDALHQFLLGNHARSRRTVLMIDEAQHLSFDVLEQIRLLTNLETDEKKLLQIILIGQPELEATLNRPDLRQLNQRITARFRLTALNERETWVYVRHRLQVAGLQDNAGLFADSALRQIYRLTGGIPRLINLLCDRALMGAYGREMKTVSAGLVKEAAREVLGDSHVVRQTGAGGLGTGRAVRSLAGLLMATAIMIAAGFVYQRGWVPSSLWDPPPTQTPAADAITPEERITPWQLEPDAAEQAFWSLWSPTQLSGSLCDNAMLNGWRCASTEADVWDSVVEVNRPVILSLRRADGFAAASVLLQIAGNSAKLWDGQSVCELPLQQLAESWRGSYQYLWRSPPEWAGPLVVGDEGPAVRYVVEAFAALDGLPVPPLKVFTEALGERVQLFQAARGLEVDGVIGERTLQALHDVLGRAPRRLPQFSQLDGMPGLKSCR
ncbi:MAG: AAA family ATPase [Luminiphilus sp.]|nr:AAA family ATPase [Luminiphilus sp.]